MKDVVSLRTKIVLLIGGLLSISMLVIYASIFFQWHKLIIEEQRNSALLVSEAYSISILDALIYQENEMLQGEDYLENYFLNFMKKNKQVLFIVVYNPQGDLIAHSNFSLKRSSVDSVHRLSSYSIEANSSIYEHQYYSWVIEAQQPPRVAGKTWGMLSMGFEADSLRKDIRNLFVMFLLLTINSILIILLILYGLTSRVTRSLRALVTEMDRTDLEHNEPLDLPKSNDEIGILIENFEHMKARLAQSREQIVNAQKQIYHAEKLASIGRLASGVAHEINNPLNGIRSCIYAINKDPDDQKQTSEYLKLIDEGIIQVETIVTKLLGFARKPAKSTALVNINESIQKVLKLLDYRLDQKDARLSFNADLDIPAVHADQHLIQEVLMNLLLNSTDAISENGEIEINTEMQNDKTVRIGIKDNGCGIPDENREVVFDPFFTTKDPGEGTGLGLSVCLSIIEAYGGSIEFNSEKNKGTEFNISLPIEETI